MRIKKLARCIHRRPRPRPCWGDEVFPPAMPPPRQQTLEEFMEDMGVTER